MGHGALLYNPGTSPAPYILNAAFPDASSKVVELLMAMRSDEGRDGAKHLADLLNYTSWADLAASARGWTVGADENNTTSVDDSASGSVGNTARIDGASANVGVMLRRRRITRTTKLDSLRGWEYVWLRLRTSAASKWEIQLRWAPSLADPATESRLSVIHDTTLASAFGYVEIPLGFVELPEDPAIALAGVALEIWARRISAVSGSPHLYMDFTRHLPATPGKDVLTKVVFPSGTTESFLYANQVTPPYKLTADPTWLAADDLETSWRLGAVNQGVGVTPNTGLPWPTGRSVLRVNTAEVLTGSSGSITFVIRVVDVDGGGGGSVVASRTITIPAGQLPALFYDLTFDTTAGNNYQAQVVCTAQSGNMAYLVGAIERIPVLSATQNEQLRSDPTRGVVEKLESDGDMVATLGTKGPVPFVIPPGLAALMGVPLDVPRSGYTEPESVKARTLTFSGKGARRSYV